MHRQPAVVSAAVVTVVAGRHRHLVNQRRAIRMMHPAIGMHVVVSLGDPEISCVLARAAHGDDPPTVVVRLPARPEGLPLSAGRNAGARAAVSGGAHLLIFLDVDCLPAPDLLARYADAAALQPNALLCGPVTYLPPRPGGEWTPGRLREYRNPHPARPDPPPGAVVAADPALFWSLSFALCADTWARAGGFDEGYVGYGAEDTDFARRAHERGVPMYWVGHADAFHQHHPTSKPPVQHVDAILRNGGRYAARWGEWPMGGWLRDFEQLGLVHRDGRDWHRSRPVRLATVPVHHPYVAAVQPRRSTIVRPERVHGWEPDPLLSPDQLRTHAQEIDVIHLHFGFEHLSCEQLRAWADAAGELGIPIVLTVHDLRNPHLDDNRRHDEHLRILVTAAARVVTLTAAAAAEIEARYGRAVAVVPHPTVVDLPVRDETPAASPTREVVVLLGMLRRNVAEPAAVVTSVVNGVDEAVDPARVRVSVRHEVADDARLDLIRALADCGRLELMRHDRFSEAELVQFVRRAHALVLPYRFGTHSGWVEVARDVGTHVVAASCGHYADQWPAVLSYTNDERHGLDATSLRTATRLAVERAPAAAAERANRLAERENIRAGHEVLYRDVMRDR